MKFFGVLVMIVVGVLFGLGLIAALPKPQAASQHSPRALLLLRHLPGHSPSPAPPPAAKPKVTEYTPWILIVLGLAFAGVFQKNNVLMGMGGTVLTAGLTALLGT